MCQGCLPKDVLCKGHALHERHWGQVDPVGHITDSVYAGYRCLVEAIHLDLPLWPKLNTNLRQQQETSAFAIDLSTHSSHCMAPIVPNFTQS